MDTNKAVAVRWFEEVWNDGSQECISELTDPDIVGHHEGGVTKRGTAGMLELQREMFATFPGVKVKVLQAIGEGDEVVVHWEFSVPASAKVPAPVAFTGMTRMRFANGKIVEGWDCWNLGALQARLAAAQS